MNINQDKITPIAYYLPQFHRLKFNDDYWGKGFTEWTNTAKAKPLFKGHYQPHVPADLGFYDLNVQSTRREQAALAQQYGIGGFCYWHYWFSEGNEVMEMPFNEVLKDKEITLPFCLAWANHDWHNVVTREVIIKQLYGSIPDYEAHYRSLSKAFHDDRYMCLDGKPIFAVFSPLEIPNCKEFFDCWNQMAKSEGFDGIYFVAIAKFESQIDECLNRGYDAVNIMRLQEFEIRMSNFQKHLWHIRRDIFKQHYVFDFATVMKFFISDRDKEENVMPTIISGWDHSPRSGKKALILDKFSPDIFEEHIDNVLQNVKDKQNKIVFIRAWNEWAEGNHLEPDLKYGCGYLQAVSNSLQKIYENKR